MDVFGIVYIIENPQQFWSELEDILHLPEDASLEQLDATLARFIHFCANYHEQYLQTPVQLEHACSLLLQSELFVFHSERMREHLLQEAESTTDPHAQLVLYEVLLLYGRNHPSFLRSQKKWQPLLPPLMDHVLLDFDPEVEDGLTNGGGGWARSASTSSVPIEARLRLLSVGILYEVCRVQKFSMPDLRIFDDSFIDHLFELVEQTRHMQDETLNYSIIKLIVALNEQFMVASLQASAPSPTASQHHHASKHSPPEESNRVLRVLMRRLNSSKTFGENMIFMLNRANRTPEDLCMQLLVLKILYLLFTTKGTSEYFYTNDLCVLVDVFLRELVDLDEESESLRHTYLRVLHPLLTRTQLRTVPYKRPQVVRTLESLVGNVGFRDVNPTTKRLVERCLSGDWCVQLRRPSLSDDPGSPNSDITVGSRVASPWADSDVASTSKSVYITSSPEEERAGGLKRNKSLKSSRSAENLRQSLSHAGKGKAHLHGGERNGIHGKLKNNSTINLMEIKASLPTVSVSDASPTSPNGSGGQGKKIRSHTLPPQGSSSSLPGSLDELGHSHSHSLQHPHPHSACTPNLRHNSLGQAAESIIAPTPLVAAESQIPSITLTANTSDAGLLGAKKNRRSAPPTPPKRRKPPAIPSQTAAGGTITTIASSSSRSTPSPLSRVPPIMPS